MEFKHIPVMLNECLEGLNIKSDGIYFDGTLGGAGHSSEILKKLNKNGMLIAVDKDDDALKVSAERLSKIADNFIVRKSDFKNFAKVLDDANIDKVDGFLLDLGVSSYQLDNAERGFSYMQDAPLDMRMDTTSQLTAEQIVNEYSAEKLIKIFYEYGEENFAKQIVRNIVEYRNLKRITTTGELADIIKRSVPKKVQIQKGNPCKKVFQAIRIEVNGELTGLEKTVEQMISRLKKGGRIAIITFHSLEDRIVKNVFKDCATGCICPKSFPICVCNHIKQVEIVNKKPIVASNLEQENNSRSLCAKLRIAEKIL